jgi:hypothetical protein
VRAFITVYDLFAMLGLMTYGMLSMGGVAGGLCRIEDS